MTNDSPSLLSLIDEATSRGITLWAAADGGLGFRAPRGALTDELRANLAAHRDALAEMFSEPKFRARGPLKRIPFIDYYATGFWQAIRSGKVGVSFVNGPKWIVQVDGHFSMAAFAASIAFVASRHDILNTTIREYDDVPHFCWERAPTVQFAELATGAGARSAPALMQILKDIVWRPFEPDVDILLRPFVVRVSASRHVIGFVLNHLIGDSSSVGVLQEEILNAYELALNGNLHDSSRPEVQYSDYILAMNAWLKSTARDYRLAYWRRHLAGITPCKLPVDRVPADGELSETRLHGFAFSSVQAEAVHRVARELSTTAYYVLAAAFARALSIAARQPDVAMVSMSHGRDSKEISATIGSMQSQILLRITSAQDLPFDALVRECQRVHGEARSFYFPFGTICYEIPGTPAQSAYPEFNYSVFAAPADRDSPPVTARGANGELRGRIQPFTAPGPSDAGTPASEFPGIKLHLQAVDSAIRGCIVYLASEYDASTMARFAELLASVVPAEQRFASG